MPAGMRLPVIAFGLQGLWAPYVAPPFFSPNFRRYSYPLTLFSINRHSSDFSNRRMKSRFSGSSHLRHSLGRYDHTIHSSKVPSLSRFDSDSRRLTRRARLVVNVATP